MSTRTKKCQYCSKPAEYLIPNRTYSSGYLALCGSHCDGKSFKEFKIKNPGNHTSVKVSYVPDCDFCSQSGRDVKAEYDGKTSLGPWANMCKAHFRMYGMGLGLGKGQKLIPGKNPGANFHHHKYLDYYIV